jgi:hypothetical protein
MFQLGMGGEFTATSMIGWIALAGIIVRNSILLVDFSIHEVQKGVPVAEAVIRACKTRTRPILITALALVAGSSVIFTDPIFQGMAISLASGVLVSTILTLIVIPLGCVAASRDLCEVAVASAPPGVTVPCSEGIPEAQQAGRAPGPEAGSGRLAPVFSKIGNVLVLILYAFRGIFLLLFDWLKGMLKRRRQRDTGGSGGGTPGPGAGPRGGGGGSSPGGDTESVRNALRRGEGVGSAEAGAARPAASGVAETASAGSTRTAKPSKVSKDSKGSAATTGGAKRTAGKAASTKSAANVVAARVQKKSPRRGIRLKTDDGDGGI